jgi:hypothetical protein
MVAITRRSLTGGIIIAFLVLVAIVSIVPLMHEASISLSSENAVLRRDVGLFPTEFSLRSYQKVFADKSIAKSLVTTSFITIVYTVISMILTICCAYPLTRPQLLRCAPKDVGSRTPNGTECGRRPFRSERAPGAEQRNAEHMVKDFAECAVTTV